MTNEFHTAPQSRRNAMSLSVEQYESLEVSGRPIPARSRPKTGYSPRYDRRRSKPGANSCGFHLRRDKRNGF